MVCSLLICTYMCAYVCVCLFLKGDEHRCVDNWQIDINMFTLKMIFVCLFINFIESFQLQVKIYLQYNLQSMNKPID